MPRGLTPKGIEIVENWQVACEDLSQGFGSPDLDPEGMAREIRQIVEEAQARVSDVLEGFSR